MDSTVEVESFDDPTDRIDIFLEYKDFSQLFSYLTSKLGYELDSADFTQYTSDTESFKVLTGELYGLESQSEILLGATLLGDELIYSGAMEVDREDDAVTVLRSYKVHGGLFSISNLTASSRVQPPSVRSPCKACTILYDTAELLLDNNPSTTRHNLDPMKIFSTAQPDLKRKCGHSVPKHHCVQISDDVHKFIRNNGRGQPSQDACDSMDYCP